jgi:hypothetical protein
MAGARAEEAQARAPAEPAVLAEAPSDVAQATRMALHRKSVDDVVQAHVAGCLVGRPSTPGKYQKQAARATLEGLRRMSSPRRSRRHWTRTAAAILLTAVSIWLETTAGSTGVG